MSANGLAAPLRLGDLTPDIRLVEVERDGRPVTLRGYVAGRRCPGVVKSRVAKVTEAYREAVMVDGEFTFDADAWYAYLRGHLQAVIEDLTFDEADALTGDQEAALDLLAALGWRERATATAADDESPDPNAEAAGETSTSPPSSPTSPPSASGRKRR